MVKTKFVLFFEDSPSFEHICSLLHFFCVSRETVKDYEVVS